MKHKIRVHRNGRTKEYLIAGGTNLLRFLRKNSGDISAPCSGKGTCGKCRVRVEGMAGGPSSKEKKLLGAKRLSKGYRLACYSTVASDLDIYLDEADGKAQIAVEARQRRMKPDSVVKKQCVQLHPPSLESQEPDIERLRNQAGFKTGVAPDLLRVLPSILREDEYKVTCVLADNKLLDLEAGDTVGKLYGLAVDIGTTTVAAYLVDLTTAAVIKTYAVLNPQKKFGQDVISRINRTMEAGDGLAAMNKALVKCLNEAVDSLTRESDIKRGDIYLAVFAGNTTMLHFLMNLPPKNIALSPFIPVTTQAHKIRADELGVRINPRGICVILPSVSAYVGADTLAAVLSSGMYKNREIALLLDLGTNGEIVLGNREWMLGCSATAGPAFEGVNISCGMGGVEGAIDKVSFGPELSYGTIGEKTAKGICGSGLVDAVAGMLSAGILDETGRILDREEIEGIPEAIRNRVEEVEGGKVFVLAEGGKHREPIRITQKDVRELQNAKAAIAAGILVLSKKAGIALGDIKKVYLAGGFGSFINIDSALAVGLIPKELRGRIEAIGNAAGAGAVEVLLWGKLLKELEEIKKRVKYMELSAESGFTDEYIQRMLFHL